jgi:hypothetical protein
MPGRKGVGDLFAILSFWASFERVPRISHLRHHPPQAPEDRRSGAQERVPDQGRDGVHLPYQTEYHLTHLYLKRAAF